MAMGGPRVTGGSGRSDGFLLGAKAKCHLLEGHTWIL